MVQEASIYLLILGKDPEALIGLAIAEGLWGVSQGNSGDGKVVPLKVNYVVEVGHGNV